MGFEWRASLRTASVSIRHPYGDSQQPAIRAAGEIRHVKCAGLSVKHWLRGFRVFVSQTEVRVSHSGEIRRQWISNVS